MPSGDELADGVAVAAVAVAAAGDGCSGRNHCSPPTFATGEDCPL